jgi:hypothetical protein
MTSSLSEYLHADHARLDALLDRAVADPARFDHAAFEAFRAGLARHIGIEEKLLLPAARRRRGGVPLEIAARLRADHGALAAMLVPTPDASLVARIRALLVAHNPLEEGPDGVYAVCEALCADELPALLEQVRAAPEVPMAPHYDGPRRHQR